MSIATAIVEAHRRGVDARWIVQGPPDAAAERLLMLCHRANVPIRMTSSEAPLHREFVVIDGETVVLDDARQVNVVDAAASLNALHAGEFRRVEADAVHYAPSRAS